MLFNPLHTTVDSDVQFCGQMKPSPPRAPSANRGAPRALPSGAQIAPARSLLADRMARTQMMGKDRKDREEAPGPAGLVAGSATQPEESKIRDEELSRMAAFRIRETANRVATLAHSVRDEALRGELLAVCQRLQAEERALLVRGRP